MPSALVRFDDQRRGQGIDVIAGLDEAGRGPLAGPVVAAVVVLPQGLHIEGLRDSKKVPEKERYALFFHVLREALDYGIAYASVQEITALNILGATRLAMTRAISMLGVAPQLLLTDAVRLPEVSIPQEPIIKGDNLSASIAAASILAKVTRDITMQGYHLQYPQYGFAKHKGYGTAAHLKAINEHGPCPAHRPTFRTSAQPAFKF